MRTNEILFLHQSEAIDLDRGIGAALNLVKMLRDVGLGSQEINQWDTGVYASLLRAQSVIWNLMPDLRSVNGEPEKVASQA